MVLIGWSDNSFEIQFSKQKGKNSKCVFARIRKAKKRKVHVSIPAREPRRRAPAIVMIVWIAVVTAARRIANLQPEIFRSARHRRGIRWPWGRGTRYLRTSIAVIRVIAASVGAPAIPMWSKLIATEIWRQLAKAMHASMRMYTEILPCMTKSQFM